MFESTCPACLGGAAKCERCRGRGKVRHVRCPSSTASSEGAHVVRLFGHYRSGFLPCAGSILEQPAKLMRMIDLAAGEVGRIEAAERERAKER